MSFVSLTNSGGRSLVEQAILWGCGRWLEVFSGGRGRGDDEITGPTEAGNGKWEGLKGTAHCGRGLKAIPTWEWWEGCC